MSTVTTESFETTTHVRPGAARLRSARVRFLAIKMTWAICLGGCVAFWWFVATALLG